MDQSDRASRCPRCGADVPPDAPEDLCPACLIAAGSAPLSHLSGDAPTVLPASCASPTAGREDAMLAPGQRFGPYRIKRLLGRGGMGDVYEAEQLEQGRRVALKVLSQRLNDPQDRARFLREGQLAASISHPHSVYIFGSEEIDGVPAIAMELLPGGTLKDRVARTGPLPPPAAVDAILQVIAGLDAAQAAGILHRDIKPSNCFVDSDGGVKVGDFGLSISTLARDVSQLTSRGTFHGTPQFASPEQLRGEPLDVRADIYAVGATLFYLLTGRPPFDERDLTALIARIATDPPPSSRSISPTIPRALAAVVVGCLAKDRAQRPASYAALDDELRPFASGAPTPATLGLRFVAGAIDGAILSLSSFPFVMSGSSRLYAPSALPWITGADLLLRLAYFGILEGLWGASIGKRICRLRVVGPDGQRPGLKRAAMRALIFGIPEIAGELVGLLLGPTRTFELAMHPGGVWLTWLMSLPYFGGLAALFSSVRRRNGFAGLHELASRTRVVQRTTRKEARDALDLAEAAEVAAARAEQRYGSFELVGALGATDRGELLLGFDPSLRRNVWIHVLPPDTAAVAPLLRDSRRPGRLRWLNGHRAAGEAWDAYEALDGAPLGSLIGDGRLQTWQRVKYWLLDLSHEIDAALRDGSLATLTLDRVWVTHEGRAKLLDFTPPGVAAGVEPARAPSFADAQVCLGALGRRALDGSAPLPLPAGKLLSRLEESAFATPGELIAEMTGLTSRADCVRPWRRALPIVLGTAPAVLMTLFALIMTPIVRTMLTKDAMELMLCLSELDSIPGNATTATRFSLEEGGTRTPTRAQAQEREWLEAQAHKREMLETYVAGRFGSMLASLSDPQRLENPAMVGVLEAHRAELDRIRANHPNVSSDETARAAADLESTLRPLREQKDLTPDASSLFFFIFAATSVFGVASAWIFRGGWLLRALGIAVVVERGQEASRLRTLWRGLVTWWPVPVVFYVWDRSFMFADSWSEVRTHPFAAICVFVLSVLFVVGAVYAVLNPERGWQDRLAGTWLVPR